MKTSKKSKNEFVKELNRKYQQIMFRFEPIQECVREHDIGTKLEEKYDKLLDCLGTFKWRIDHFAENDAKPGEIVETSFDDILDEIDWRLREVELGLKGQNICDEGQNKQMAKNYHRKSEK